MKRLALWIAGLLGRSRFERELSDELARDPPCFTRPPGPGPIVKEPLPVGQVSRPVHQEFAAGIS